jgi:hypothetical protein
VLCNADRPPGFLPLPPRQLATNLKARHFGPRRALETGLQAHVQYANNSFLPTEAAVCLLKLAG